MGPDPISALPAVNATLNGIAAILLVIGYVLIRQRRWRAHRAVMLAAFGTSVLFLISYVIYHANAGSRPFQGHGPIRIVYFTILITHVILAAAIVPLALITLWRGLRGTPSGGDPEGSPYARHGDPEGSPYARHGDSSYVRSASVRNVRHARIARWTLPIWLYVSVTGVVVYLMLYRM